MTIRHEHGKWNLYNKAGTKKLSEHDTEEGAKKQEEAINIAKAREAGHNIPKQDGVFRTDRGELKSPEYLPNGWLKADGYLTRTGVFKYTTADGKDWFEYRPPDEVFNQDALDSFAMVPMTNNHPPTGRLDADNTKMYQVGTVSAPQKDGDKMRADMLVTDTNTINDIKRGKVEISCGYVADLDMTPGEHDGQRYDAVQRNIRGNHVALVKEGRAGSSVRLRNDSYELESDIFPIEEVSMTAKMKIDGLELDATDVAVQAFEKYDAKISAQVTQAKNDLEKEKARADVAEAEVKKLKADLAEAPAKVAAQIKTRVALEGKAKDILGEFKSDASDADLRKAIAEKVNGVKLDGKSDAYVEASYDIAVAKFSESPRDTIPTVKVTTDSPVNTLDALQAAFKESSRNAYKTAKVG